MNGTIYWLLTQGITSFDVNSERSQFLSYAPGALGMINGKLCAAHVRGQRLVVSMLSNSHLNTMQILSNARTWVEMQADIDLEISLPAESCNYASYGYPGRYYGHGH